MIAGTYHPGLVAFSVLIAIVASYAAFNLAERVSATSGQRRWIWLTSGAVAMGSGIWSMHYVGMLAFVLPVPVLYHVPTVIVSLHYVGMAAMRSAAMHHYSRGLVIVSIVVAITCSTVAAWLAFRFRRSH